MDLIMWGCSEVDRGVLHKLEGNIRARTKNVDIRFRFPAELLSHAENWITVDIIGDEPAGVEDEVQKIALEEIEKLESELSYRHGTSPGGRRVDIDPKAYLS